MAVCINVQVGIITTAGGSADCREKARELEDALHEVALKFAPDGVASGLTFIRTTVEPASMGKHDKEYDEIRRAWDGVSPHLK